MVSSGGTRLGAGDGMNFRRLQYFVKIVDIGSLTQAADILHVAQPALSQQLATLEAEVRQQLLVRTKRGVTPTEAGTVLYRHAQLILRQCEQARVDMKAAGQGLSGRGVGRPRAGHGGGGPGACRCCAPCARAIPGIVLYLNETYGTTLSELIMNGRMDLAVLYGGTTAVHGLSFQLLLLEPLFLVGPRQHAGAGRDRCRCATSCEMELFLPRPYNVVRKMVDDACAGVGPGAARRRRDRIRQHAHRGDRRRPGRDDPAGVDGARRWWRPAAPGRSRIVEPSIEAPLALCQSDHLPLSEPAQAVKEILLDLAGRLPGARLKPPATQARAAGHKRALSRQRRSVLARPRPSSATVRGNRLDGAPDGSRRDQGHSSAAIARLRPRGDAPDPRRVDAASRALGRRQRRRRPPPARDGERRAARRRAPPPPPAADSGRPRAALRRSST